MRPDQRSTWTKSPPRYRIGSRRLPMTRTRGTRPTMSTTRIWTGQRYGSETRIGNHASEFVSRHRIRLYTSTWAGMNYHPIMV